MKSAAVAVVALFVGMAHAGDTNMREQALRQIGMAVVSGQCTVVLAKEGQTTATPGHYLANHERLHECQYVQEMLASPCVKLKACPTYESWSRSNPDFSPALPRGSFEQALDARQAMVAAMRAAAKQ